MVRGGAESYFPWLLEGRVYAEIVQSVALATS